jgi:hypothetical protein
LAAVLQDLLTSWIELAQPIKSALSVVAGFLLPEDAPLPHHEFGVRGLGSAFFSREDRIPGTRPMHLKSYPFEKKSGDKSPHSKDFAKAPKSCKNRGETR